MRARMAEAATTARTACSNAHLAPHQGRLEMKAKQLLWIIALGVALLGSAGIGAASAQEPQPQNQNPPAQAEAAKPSQVSPAPPAASGSETKATLYVYRHRRYEGYGLKPSVYADDRELARMENGRFFVVKLDPGMHTIRSNDKSSGIEVDLKAGQDYYVRIDIEAGAWKGHGRITLVLPEQGRYEVKETKPLNAGAVKNHELVVVDANAPEK